MLVVFVVKEASYVMKLLNFVCKIHTFVGFGFI